MKIKRFIAVVLILISGILTSACSSPDEWFNNGKYGTFKINVKNIERHVKSFNFIDENGCTYDSDNHCFTFSFKAVLNNNVKRIDEDIEVVYVVNLIVDYYDSTNSFVTKEWENIEIDLNFGNGERQQPETSGEAVVTVAPIENAVEFGEASATKSIYYYQGVKRVAKATMEIVYIKSASGKLFIDRPEVIESSSATV